jgi:hypothetical protein
MTEDLFGFDGILLDPMDDWVGMPEYHMEKEVKPMYTATFKFRNQDDYEDFKAKAKNYIFDNQKVFDGNQGEFDKQAWYPLDERPSKFYYESQNPKNPRFPVYILSKGRFKINPTSRVLERMNVPFKIIVEEFEYEEYAKIIDKSKILILPQKYKDEYDMFWNDGGKTGGGPARNFAWDHSIANGHQWHWLLDDNIEYFKRTNNNKKIRCNDGTMFYACEDFVLRYENIAIAGPNYTTFCHANDYRPPFTVNTKVYSCLLIRNDIPFRWRGRFNEDVDLCLRAMKAGWCTISFNAFLQDKMSTQKMRGGNTDEIYQDGTYLKSKMLQEMHPDLAVVTTRFNRPHHYVDYSVFKKNFLIKKLNLQEFEPINNYGMVFKEK